MNAQFQLIIIIKIFNIFPKFDSYFLNLLKK